MLDEVAKEDIAALDVDGLRRLVLGVEKKINKNQQMRMKFPDEPAKFLESELALNDEVVKLAEVAASPELLPHFVELGAVRSLLGLLTHENTDVSLAVISVLVEITDPSTYDDDGAEDEDDDDDEEEGLGRAAAQLRKQERSRPVVGALVENQGLVLLVQNLSRLDEAEDADAQGVNQTLSIFENLVELQPQLAVALCESTDILKHLLLRLKVKQFDANKLFASELLCVLLQADTDNQRRLGNLTGMDGMDALLQAVAHYRKRDPETKDEEELVANLFNALCTALLVSENQEAFRRAEGMELMARCLRERRHGAAAAVRVLDFALAASPANALKIVEVGGLKTLFPVLMGRDALLDAGGKKGSKKRKRGKADLQELEEKIVSVVSQMCTALHSERQLDSNLRLVAKFQENGCEKVKRLVELFSKYAKKVRMTRQALMEQGLDEAVLASVATDAGARELVQSELLDGGLYTLQRVAITLAYCCVHSDRCCAELGAKLRLERLDPRLVQDALRGYVEMLDDEEAAAAAGGGAGGGGGDEEAARRREHRDLVVRWTAGLGTLLGVAGDGDGQVGEGAMAAADGGA